MRGFLALDSLFFARLGFGGVFSMRRRMSSSDAGIFPFDSFGGLVMATIRDAHDTIYKLIGEATVAWNGVEHGWMLVFQALLGAPQRHAKAIYRAVLSNAAQRDMIEALARAAYRDNDAMRDKVVKLLKETGQESGWRHSFAHGFYAIDVYEVAGKPGYAFSPLKIIEDARGRLGGKNLETELVPLIAKFNNLGGRVFALLRDIDEHAPSPDTRPQR